MRIAIRLFTSLFFLTVFIIMGPVVISGCSSSRDRPDRDAAVTDEGGITGDGAVADTGGFHDAGDGDGSSLADAYVSPDSSVNPDDPLQDRLTTSQLTVPEGVKGGVSNWRIWGRSSLHVGRVFTAPLANCETLVGFTTSGGGGLTPRVARISPDDELVEVHDLTSGLECRGLAAEPDGHFAALLWSSSEQSIYVTRYDPSGTELWTQELTNSNNTPTDFGIGDSRFEYGGGKYGAYYHVHSDSGHEGDTLKWVTTAGSETTGWSWGCSHSMSNLLRYNQDIDRFMPACVTDCYPGTSGDFSTNAKGGIYINHNSGHVIDMCAGCNGSVAGELGGGAISPDGWKIVFNTHQADLVLGQGSYDSSTMNQDVGFASISSSYSSTDVVWLTNTSSINETDPTMARWTPVEDDTEQYVVGWAEPSGSYVYKLGRVDASGGFLEGPVVITGLAAWGRRDDPMRRHFNGDIVWAWFDSPGSTTLNFARILSGHPQECVSF